MEEVDLTPSRLEAARQALREFVASDKRDHFGIVIYGSNEPRWVTASRTRLTPSAARRSSAGSSCSSATATTVHVPRRRRTWQEPFFPDADPAEFMNLAARTGGRFYRERDTASLERDLHALALELAAP